MSDTITPILGIVVPFGVVATLAALNLRRRYRSVQGSVYRMRAAFTTWRRPDGMIERYAAAVSIRRTDGAGRTYHVINGNGAHATHFCHTVGAVAACVHLAREERAELAREERAELADACARAWLTWALNRLPADGQTLEATLTHADQIVARVNAEHDVPRPPTLTKEDKRRRDDQERARELL